MKYKIYAYTKDWRDFWDKSGVAYPNSFASVVGKAIYSINPGLFDRMEFWAAETKAPDAQLLRVNSDPTIVFIVESAGRNYAVAKLNRNQITEQNVRKLMLEVLALTPSDDGTLLNTELQLVGINTQEYAAAPGGALISINPWTNETQLDFDLAAWKKFWNSPVTWLLIAGAGYIAYKERNRIKRAFR